MQYNAKDYKSLQNLLIGRECAASVLLEIGSIGQFQLNTLQFFFFCIYQAANININKYACITNGSCQYTLCILFNRLANCINKP